MLGLLQRKPEPRGRLDIRRATQVFDAVPCDVFKPLEVHDLFIHAERASSRPNKSRSSSGGAAVEA